MNGNVASEIRKDYLEWSGGFPPDDERDIFIYTEYSRVVDDEALVLSVLREWRDQTIEENMRDQ
jgi:hypothetical protein